MSAAPTVSVSAPGSVQPGQSFSVSMSVADPDGDLTAMSLRWQGHGIIANDWNLNGSSASIGASVTAPDSGTQYFRGEVVDKEGHGTTGDWEPVSIVPPPPPPPPAPAPAVVAPPPPPPPSNPPQVTVSVPASVQAGQTFTATISVSDPDGDLAAMSLRLQGTGIIAQNWNLSGGSATTSAQVTAPSSGPMLFRGEVVDQAGHGTTGDWQTVNVIVPAPAPAVVTPPPPAPVVIAPTPAAPIVVAPPPPPPPSNPPQVTVSVPSSVNAGEIFTATISVSDPDGDLTAMSLRLQGTGIIAQDWNLSGGSATTSTQVTAPNSGPMLFRGEVVDQAGHGTTGDWQTVNVIVPAVSASVSVSTPAVPISSEVTTPYTAPGSFPGVDNSQAASQAAPMPAGTAPTVDLSMPRAVYAGETFNVDAVARDPDGDLAYMTIRWQGHGSQLFADFTDRGFNTASGARATITAPDTGPILIRAEVNDKSGNGFTSDWYSIDVIPKPAPTIGDVSTWVNVVRTPTSAAGVYRNQLQLLPGAPDLVAQAVAQTMATEAIFPSYTPAALLDLLRQNYLRLAANAEDSGTSVAPVQASGVTGDASTTIVAYEGTNPVYQTVTPTGVVQYTDTPTGPTTPVVVDVPLGTYVPPEVSPLIALTLPNTVLPGQKFTVTATASDGNGNLSNLQILSDLKSWGDWPISGNSQTRSVEITAPQQTGTMQFSAIVRDQAGNSVSSDWQTVAIKVDPKFDPVHRLAGWDAVGNDVYHLIDEGGNTIEWAVRHGDDSSTILPGTARRLTGANPDQSQVVSVVPPSTTTTTVVDGTPSTSPLPQPGGDGSSDVSPIFDGTHRLVGWDKYGNEVYHLIDEGGHTIEWAVLPGDDSRTIIDGTLRAIDGPAAMPTQVVSLVPPGSSTGGGGSGVILALAVIGLGFAVTRRRKQG